MTPPRIPRTLVGGLSFPEGPRWHQGRLWFSDIHDHRLCRLDGDELIEIAHFDDRPSGIGFLPNGKVLVVSLLDRRLIAVTGDGAQSVHADLSHLSGNFINDMVVDARGRAYVGSRNGQPPHSATDSLIFVDTDGRCRTEIDDMVTPNGAVLLPGGQTMIVAETAAGRLRRFTLAPDGSLGNRETIFEQGGRHIDGICLDAEGGIWAGGGVGGLLRISAGGELVEAIEFPGRMVLATALGGPNGTTLFLATASLTLLDNLARLGADRTLDSTINSDGRIETIEVEVPGADV